MKWYLTKIVYRIFCGAGNHTAQFDEQLRLITAACEDEALEKALAIGRDGQDTFYNLDKQLVQWQFVNVTELYCLTEWVDGAEVYSCIKEVASAEAYTLLVNDKAAMMQQKQSRKLLKLI
ncbi:MAG: hypothetical protein JWQ96_1920 [Segetibacter sp.]|nr:hypothetical protein [Segetibacter sp.]